MFVGGCKQLIAARADRARLEALRMGASKPSGTRIGRNLRPLSDVPDAITRRQRPTARLQTTARGWPASRERALALGGAGRRSISTGSAESSWHPPGVLLMRTTPSRSLPKAHSVPNRLYYVIEP